MQPQKTNNSDGQVLQHSCKVTIEYEDSIRSIDLENLLSGIRMICQHEMSVKFGGTPRDYTDCTKIQSIENGSIEINMLFDLVHINIDLIEVNLNLLSVDIDFVDIILAYLVGRNVIPGKLKVAYNALKAAIKNFKCIRIQGSQHNAKVTVDKNGDVVMTDER